MQNDIADVGSIIYDDKYNPHLRSPNTSFEQPFKQDRDSLMDVDYYKHFLENAISRFRHSRTYKNYKHYLYELGLDRCQLLGQVTSEIATIEMHHNFLNIFDITLMICEHMLNTVGYVTTFDLVQALKEEHKNNRIPIVMLSKTAHQLYHNADGMVLPARMCFGYWIELLSKYNKGITIDIAQKIITFIYRSIEFEKQYIESDMTNNLLEVRDNVIEWSEYNDYADHMRINGVVM